jgi:hypothetical protein
VSAKGLIYSLIEGTLLAATTAGLVVCVGSTGAAAACGRLEDALAEAERRGVDGSGG